MIINPGFSFNYHLAITLSDTVKNLVGVRYIQNIGTSGSVVIRQIAGDTTNNPTTITACPVWLNQGESVECGRFWVGANSTSATAGLSLIGFK